MDCQSVSLVILVWYSQPAKAFLDEFFRVEIHWVTWANLTIGDPVQYEHGVGVGSEYVEPPSTLRIGLQVVEKPLVTVGDQLAANPVAVGIGYPTVGQSSLRQLEPSRAGTGWVAWAGPRTGAGWSESWREGWRRGSAGRSWCRYLGGWPQIGVPKAQIGWFWPPWGSGGLGSVQGSLSGASGRLLAGFHPDGDVAQTR